jgi:PKHD-type hydroxylase
MNIQTHLLTPKAFTPDECREVIEEFSGTLFDASVRFEKPVTDQKIRKTSVVAIPEEHWLTEALMSFCEIVNRKFWDLDITECDVLQFGKYERGGHYDWHMDVDPFHAIDGKQRKVTAVLALDDPDDYSGGELELQNKSLGKLTQGDVVVFPSFLQHRVKPVHSGLRHTVVCWAKGPKFR